MACPPSPVADDPSALPSPTSSPSSSVTLLACSLDASPWMLAVPLYFSKSCTIRLIMFSLLFVFVFLCIIYVKSIINLLQYHII